MFWKGSFFKKAFLKILHVTTVLCLSFFFLKMVLRELFLDVDVQRSCMILMYRKNVKKCRIVNVLKKKGNVLKEKLLNKGFSENFGYNRSALFMFQKRRKMVLRELLQDSA